MHQLDFHVVKYCRRRPPAHRRRKSQPSYNTGEILRALTRDEDVKALRDNKSADLVVLVIHRKTGVEGAA